MLRHFAEIAAPAILSQTAVNRARERGNNLQEGGFARNSEP
jgi:hypothetical protein